VAKTEPFCTIEELAEAAEKAKHARLWDVAVEIIPESAPDGRGWYWDGAARRMFVLMLEAVVKRDGYIGVHNIEQMVKMGDSELLDLLQSTGMTEEWMALLDGRSDKAVADLYVLIRRSVDTWINGPNEAFNAKGDMNHG